MKEWIKSRKEAQEAQKERRDFPGLCLLYYNSPECSRAARILAAKKHKRRKTRQLPFCAFYAFSRLSPFGCGCAALSLLSLFAASVPVRGRRLLSPRRRRRGAAGLGVGTGLGFAEGSIGQYSIGRRLPLRAWRLCGRPSVPFGTRCCTGSARAGAVGSVVGSRPHAPVQKTACGTGARTFLSASTALR